MNLRIGILGTRGIPNNYGGYEQAASYLSKGLAAKGYEVCVYNSHNHPYQKKEWNGVQIIHCYDPENSIGTAGQFIYDLNCIVDAGRRNFDVIVFLGYTSSSVWRHLFPRNAVIISNMDGLEWKRTKYTRPVRSFLKYAEKLAVRHSHFHIADSPIIKKYLDAKYDIDSHFISYGAEKINYENNVAATLEFPANEYFLLMARIQPDNNVEVILDGFVKSNNTKQFVVIGDIRNKFGRGLLKKFRSNEKIKFVGSIFDKQRIARLTRHSCIYFHGHSVGGTNPSLLEAMANEAFIAAHDNPYNKAVLNDDANYFSTSHDVRDIIDGFDERFAEACISSNASKITNHYSWEKIINEYDVFIKFCFLIRQNANPVLYRRFVGK